MRPRGDAVLEHDGCDAERVEPLGHFSAFEIPLLLGPTAPRTLPVAAWDAYRSVDPAGRIEAGAIAMVVALASIALCLLYLRLARRAVGT